MPSLAALNDSVTKASASAAPSSAATAKAASLPADAKALAEGKDVFEKERADLYRQLDEKVCFRKL